MIAKKIQAGVKQAAGNCDIVRIEDANPRRLYEYDLIGLGSAVWGEGPVPFKNFIDDMRSLGGKHAFVFCTHGIMPEMFFPIMVPRVKQRGMIIIGWDDWFGDYIKPWLAYPYHTAGHPDEIDLKEAMEGVLGSTTLRDLAERHKKKEQPQPAMYYI